VTCNRLPSFERHRTCGSNFSKAQTWKGEIMLQFRQIIAGMAHGLFRAGHLFLLVTGIFALTQIIPLRTGTNMAGEFGNADTMFASVPRLSPATNSLIDDIRGGFSTLTSLFPAATPSAAIMISAPSTLTTLDPAKDRLSAYIARRYRVSDIAIDNLIAAAYRIGRETGVDPLLIVAVTAVESGFNPLAESANGAQGLMQVMSRVHADKLTADAREDAMFEPETNLRIGTQVLKDVIRRHATLELALQAYAGALSDTSAGYARKVLDTRERLVQAMRG
jgi:soluble lytic murein transglycosylase-like protein